MKLTAVSSTQPSSSAPSRPAAAEQVKPDATTRMSPPSTPPHAWQSTDSTDTSRPQKRASRRAAMAWEPSTVGQTRMSSRTSGSRIRASPSAERCSVNTASSW